MLLQGNSKNTQRGSGKLDSDLEPKKQKRRAQVRKAQIEHRQRKENHGKHLEQQIIILREKIAQTETQVVLFKHENIAIKASLQGNSFPLPLNFPFSNPASHINTNVDIDMLISNYIAPTSLSWTQNTTLVRTIFDPFLDEECLQISHAGSFPLTVESHSSFGAYAAPDLSVLDTSISLPSPDIFNSKNWKPAVLAQQEREKVYHQQRIEKEGGRGGNTAGAESLGEQMETLAINFILALEHPCRKHFSPPSTDPWDPEGRPSGHELMASTHLFSHPSSFVLAQPHQHPHPHRDTYQHIISHSPSNPPFPLHNTLPPPITSTLLPPNPTLKTNTTKTLHKPPRTPVPPPNISFTHHPTIGASPGSTWLIPPPTLQNLHAMSESMVKEDWEMTPVQAWFLLEGRYGWERLLNQTTPGSVDVDVDAIRGGIDERMEGARGGCEAGEAGGEGILDSLKRRLAKLVTCQDFGSVIDENGFWGVVRSVLGEDGGGKWV
ncbi:hypothetical protein WAI453_005367 [Rhynchosporium graminicola]|uniref:BZIP domain-containing protein n=1 Tax=Rhynchosporium graminicola TaxID=2792576 RepID=A0A1E1LS10_9HELO|nr:uncharacterized protein RCO7_05267 [Rhynchosporium commune]